MHIHIYALFNLSFWSNKKQKKLTGIRDYSKYVFPS